jgi:hypothetical protein
MTADEPDARPTRRALLGAIVALASVALAVAGRRASGDDEDVPDPEEAAKGELVLRIDGVETKLPLDALNHNEVEAGSKTPDSFEFAGAGVLLAGMFPPAFKPNADADWKALVGKPIAIKPKQGDAESELALPGDAKPSKVAGGSFTIDAFTTGPLRVRGKITLKLRGAAGEKTADGTFDVGVIRYG